MKYVLAARGNARFIYKELIGGGWTRFATNPVFSKLDGRSCNTWHFQIGVEKLSFKSITSTDTDSTWRFITETELFYEIL